MAIATGFLADCVGCAESIPPAGLDVLGLGLAVSIVALAPFAALHRFLRSRGR
jgi:hypothetical protein